MAFDGFSEQLVSYIRDIIKTAAEGTAMNFSKRFKIWLDFHEVRLQCTLDGLHYILKSLCLTSA